MKAVSCNQINGGHRKPLCPGAPQGPAWYQQAPNPVGHLNKLYTYRRLVSNLVLCGCEYPFHLLTRISLSSKIQSLFRSQFQPPSVDCGSDVTSVFKSFDGLFGSLPHELYHWPADGLLVQFSSL